MSEFEDSTPQFSAESSQPADSGITPEAELSKQPEYVRIINELITAGSLVIFSGFDHNAVEAQAPNPAERIQDVQKGGSRNFAALVAIIDSKGIRRLVYAKQIKESMVESEIRAHEIATEAGVEHFVPYAYSRTGADSVYLTLFRKVVPLDKYRITSFERYQQLTFLIVEELKKLHKRGLRHRDPQARNFGLDPATVGTGRESLLVYDYEDSKLYMANEIDSEDYLEDCRGEIHNALFGLRHSIPDEIREVIVDKESGITLWQAATTWAAEQINNYSL